jgi:hypothetical protein
MLVLVFYSLPPAAVKALCINASVHCLPATSTLSRTNGMTPKSLASLVMTGQQDWVRGQYAQEKAKVKS